MSYHLTSRTFYTEAECIALESQLRQNGFRQVSHLAKLKANEYRMTTGTSDPKTFEGRTQWQIEWCEDK